MVWTARNAVIALYGLLCANLMRVWLLEATMGGKYDGGWKRGHTSTVEAGHASFETYLKSFDDAEKAIERAFKNINKYADAAVLADLETAFRRMAQGKWIVIGGRIEWLPDCFHFGEDAPLVLSISPGEFVKAWREQATTVVGADPGYADAMETALDAWERAIASARRALRKAKAQAAKESHPEIP
jgi:hypothetical protein